MKLSRAKLESLVDDLISPDASEPCQRRAEGCRRDGTADIQEVILVGGMTRMPKVIEVG